MTAAPRAPNDMKELRESDDTRALPAPDRRRQLDDAVVAAEAALLKVNLAMARRAHAVARCNEEIAFAKKTVSEAVRRLRDIEPGSARLSAIRQLYGQPGVMQRDLAWAMFGDQNKQWHLRKLLKPSMRNCERCGTKVHAGSDFEARSFFCKPCRNERHAEWQKGRCP